MTRTTTWKAITVGAALGLLSVTTAGAASATVAPPAQALSVAPASSFADVPLASGSADLRPDRGADTSRTRTRGSTQIYTSPDPSVGHAGNVTSLYGPFFEQNRGLGGAAAIGATAGGR